MKVLHTSDWHLGQKFISREREEEHAMALEWLVKTIDEKKVEVLLVAGDVFDIGNPPSSSRATYYGFLKKLLKTHCRHIVITGGNHDSPQMLDAPREILEIFNVHIVGKAKEDVSEEVIVLNDENGKPECVVAAVPFLRDQDLRRAVSGETSDDRVEAIRQGILAHYEAVGMACEAYTNVEIPIIAMGHLCATGAKSSGKQDNIYLGSLENIEASKFPKVFDYVALGHIHREQAIGDFENIRYSGSIIPLSFSETKDDKSVTLLQFRNKVIEERELIPVPQFRRLKTIEGSFDYVKERLEKLNMDYADGLPAWVEIIVETETVIPNLNGQLIDFAAGMNLEILKVRTNSSNLSLEEQMGYEELDDLTPFEVFQKKLASAGKPPEDAKVLEETFRELETWMNEKEG